MAVRHTYTLRVGTGETPPFLFRSLWNDSLGTADAAILDGGKWTTKHGCGSTVARLEVVARAGVGWTGPGNVLQVGNSGGGCGSFDVLVPGIADGASYRIGFARRVRNDTGDFCLHPDSINPVGAIEAILWGAIDGDGAEYSQNFRALTASAGGVSQRCPPLPQEEWLWFEFGVEIVSFALRRFRVWPFVYSYPAGELLYDASDYLEAFGAGPDTLADWYAAGEYIQGATSGTGWETRWKRLGTGNEGQAGANAGRWWTAAYTVAPDWDVPIGPPAEV